MGKLYVYSGDCIMGELGKRTHLVDFVGNNLFVGDIVLVSTIDEQGFCATSGLSVVVENRYTTYGNGTYCIDKLGLPFVMGILGVDFTNDTSQWMVNRVKKFSDVIAGERMPQYGFSFDKMRLRLVEK